MPSGSVSAAEWRRFEDTTTGLTVTQMTNTPGSRNVPFYFHDPAWTPDSRWMVLGSNRTGRNELFAVDAGDGAVVQLTDGGVCGGMVSRLDGRVMYRRENEMRAVAVDGTGDALIGVVPGEYTPYTFPFENADGSLLVFGARSAHRPCVMAMRTSDGTVFTIHEDGRLAGHIHCSPTDPELIMHCDATVSDAEVKQRVWLLTTDGQKHWHPYTQTPQEWLTHESWLGTTGKVLVCYWPTGIMEIRPDGSGARLIARVNAWHAGATADGSLCVVDTNWPERGLFLIDTSTGRMCMLVESGNSGGDQGAVEMHPHPSFSPDGKTVMWGSERTGSPEAYCVDVAPALEDESRWFTPQHTWHRW